MGIYFDGMESIFIQLEAMNRPMIESLQVAMLLPSFANVDESPYVTVVTALQTLSEENLTWRSVTARLIQEYDSRKRY